MMKTLKGKDILGPISTTILSLLILIGLFLFIGGRLSGPGGHPSNDIIATVLIIFMAAFIAPLGAVIGLAGSVLQYKRFRNFRAVLSNVGFLFNSAIFFVGLFFYVKYLFK